MDPLNLILLIIVVLVGWRLRSVLGTRNDDEKPSSRADAYRLNRDAFARKPDTAQADAPRADEPRADEPRADDQSANDQSADEKGAAEAADNPTPQADEHSTENPDAAADETPAQSLDDATPEMGRGLAFLRAVEPQFDEAAFLEGAGQAYEMILTAFAAGDLSPVEGFLGADVTDGFAAAIVARRDNNQQLVTQILRLDRPALEDAIVSEATMQLDVRFRAEIISGSFSADIEIGEDDLPVPATVIDVWRFEGRRGEAPNWTLIGTQAG